MISNIRTFLSDKKNHILFSVTNMTLRGLGLAGRFVLSIYLAKYLDMETVGLFGLVAGAAGIAPALFGWGINYYIWRELVGRPMHDAGAMIRDRFLFQSISLLIVTTFTFLFFLSGIVPAPAHLGQLTVIILLEIFALDSHMVLIGLRQPLLANFLIFVRSALWVFPYVGISYYFAEYRTFDFLIDLWISSLILTHILIFNYVRGWPWKQIISIKINLHHFIKMLGKSWVIYLSDLGLVGALFVDRFVVNHFMGLKQTGIFVFFWTIANAVQVLVATSIVQVAAPHLVETYRKHGEAIWRRELLKETTKALMAGVILSVLIYSFVLLLLPFLGRPELLEATPLLAILLISALVRIISDMANNGLYCRGQDISYAVINICGLVVGLILNVIAIRLWGLYGAACSISLTATLLLLTRFYYLSLHKDAAHLTKENEVGGRSTTNH